MSETSNSSVVIHSLSPAKRLLVVSVARILQAVIAEQHSLDTAFTQYLPTPSESTSFIKAASYGVLRQYWRLENYLQQLLSKPLKKKDHDVHCLLLCGLYELFDMHTPDHAVVSETVNAVNEMNKTWAKGLVNAVLRNAQRRHTQLQQHVQEDPQAGPIRCWTP